MDKTSCLSNLLFVVETVCHIYAAKQPPPSVGPAGDFFHRGFYGIYIEKRMGISYYLQLSMFSLYNCRKQCAAYFDLI